MNINFPLVLVILTALSGLIYLMDVLFWEKKRLAKNKKMPVFIDYARSFFTIFLLVLIIRSFIVSPFRVPSGSMEPTIVPNDFIIVNQFAYGLRLPVLNTKVVSIGEPKRGDVVVFRYPGDPKVDFIKRAVGLPGDHVVYKDRQLTINGKLVETKLIGDGWDLEEPVAPDVATWTYEETLGTAKHRIYGWKSGARSDAPVDVIVPKNMYFMMGDNRDNSGDSRFFGFVPEENIVGKAVVIWFSWAGFREGLVRWSRLGSLL